MVVQIGQNGGREPIDPSQQVVRRDHLIEAKLVKELPLISVLPPHHRRLSCRLLSRNHCSLGSSSPFSTASTRLRRGPRQETVGNCCEWMKAVLQYELRRHSKLAAFLDLGRLGHEL